jgi:F-type H+-transporting ATPase subunit a
MTEAEPLSGSEYVAHHLRHLASGSQNGLFDPSVVHYDTLAFSLLTVALVLIVMRLVAARATAAVPGRFQALVEWAFQTVDEQAKAMVSVDRTYAAPLALTVYIWVMVMNAIDLFPVDWIPGAARVFGVDHLRPLPTADLNAPLGMALGVLILSLYYAIKVKGLFGFIKELFVAPFGKVHLSLNPLTWIGAAFLAVANFGLNIIEYVSKTFSMGMRLFGNMYAGELLFFLIALLGGAFALDSWRAALGSVGLAFVHVLLGFGWEIFHILIVILQAFIFMMLTLVYIGQAQESHAAH